MSASDIKPGDLIDVSFTKSYLNKTDGMTHLSAKAITLHRMRLPNLRQKLGGNDEKTIDP